MKSVSNCSKNCMYLETEKINRSDNSVKVNNRSIKLVVIVKTTLIMKFKN
jgi:hypothetical protein